MLRVVSRRQFLAVARRRIGRFAFLTAQLCADRRRSLAFGLWVIVMVDELFDGSQDIAIAPVERGTESIALDLRKKSCQSVDWHAFAIVISDRRRSAII